MVFTILMFFSLIALFISMIGLVKFSENVIATPRLAPVGNGTATKTVGGTESH
jgi:hypothetical protein